MKREVVHIYTTTQEKKMIALAAKKENRSMSGYLKHHGLKKAQQNTEETTNEQTDEQHEDS